MRLVCYLPCLYAALNPSGRSGNRPEGFGHSRAPVGIHKPRERAAMPTRRIFELVIVTGFLLFPATRVVRLWAKRQLGSQPEGSLMHGIGEVVVTVL